MIYAAQNSDPSLRICPNWHLTLGLPVTFQQQAERHQVTILNNYVRTLRSDLRIQLLETELQPELQVTRWISASRNPEKRVVQAGVVADQKICMVEDVEGFSSKLQMGSFRNPEVLENRHVGRPVARTYKRIAAKVPHAAQTRS